MIRSLFLAAGLAASSIAAAQTITTIAGGGLGDGRPAIEAQLSGPSHLALDAAGNLYIADAGNYRVRRVDATTGIISTVAGNGDREPASNGGQATSTALSFPSGVAIDGSGNLVLTAGNQVRRVDMATGIISTMAGAFATPFQVARDSAGNLFVADVGGQVSRIDAATGAIAKVAGGGSGGDGEIATNASLVRPYGVAVDAAGNLYIAEDFHRIRKVDASTHIITTVAGLGVAGFSGDGGPATAATLNAPRALAVDASGHLYISDTGNQRVRRIDASTGVITTVAGGGSGTEGGPATDALLDSPIGLAFDGAGRLYISDSNRNRVWRVAGGTIEPFVGNAVPFLGNGLPAMQARLVSPGSAGMDAGGNLFIAEPAAGRIRRVDAATGVIQAFAGTGVVGSSGDGGAALAATIKPDAIAVAPNGDVFLANSTSIRKITAATGIIETVVTGTLTEGLAVDAGGNVYFGEPNLLRRRDAVSGAVSTVANVAVQRIAVDVNGDVYVAGPAGLSRVVGGNVVSLAFVDASYGLAVRNGNVYFSGRFWPYRVQLRLASDGSISRYAGGGTNSLSPPLGDNGPALQAGFSGLIQLATTPGGALLISDATAGRVRRVAVGTLSASPGLLAFDGRLPQTSSFPKRTTITNFTDTPVTLNSITAAPPFTIASNCGASLAAGAGCSVDATFAPPAVGTYSNAIQFDTSAGPVSVQLQGVGEISLVTFYYESILRRPPDSSGKPYWDGERARMQGLGANPNETWFAMSSAFFASGEYKSFNRDATSFVTDLYKTFFNRDPDAPGQQFWISQLANGMPREAVLAEFQLSGEFAQFTQNLFGNTAVRAEMDMVMDFYRGLLGRLPDSGGFNAWVQQFRAAQCQPNPLAAVTAAAESISESFATSPEYAGKNRDNGQYVGDLYNAFLRRGGDLGGVVNWINSLASNTFTRKQLRDNFRASTEFTTRLSQVAAQGCLP